MTTKLFALVLEDVKKDSDLLNEILSAEGFTFHMDVVSTKTDYVLHLKCNFYNIIFADFTLPSFNGQEALELAKEICPNIPFICISGTIGEERAVELLKQGATDYVLKDRMDRLAFATKRALEATEQLSKFRQTEIELQTNRRLLQSIINNALDAIYIKDINGRYILFNDAAEKAFGKNASEVIGKDDTFILSAKEAQMTMDIDKNVIKSGVPYSSEEPFTLIDGNIHIFHVIKCPMFDDFGNPSGLFGIARDITERKQMEINLTIAKEKAEESDRLKTAFLHNISHEIRTPLNAIIGFAEFLNEPEQGSETHNQYKDIIVQSSHQLLSIISNIMNIAAIEAGQEAIFETKIDLNSLLLHLHDQFLFKAKFKNDRIINAILPDSDICIVSDETKLIQILSNLISNAIKFSVEGSINFGYSVKCNEIEFFVEDTGIGISPDMHEEIFKRFRQVENANTRQFGGSGLGLSISKSYVELLGGKIWLESDLDKGSTFYFTIPLKVQ